MAVNLERNQKVFDREAALARRIPVNFETFGAENIVHALELLDRGVKLFIVSDHRSTADTTTGIAIAAKSKTKFDELLARSVVTIKDSYLKNRLFRYALSGVRTIGVASPSMVEAHYPNATAINKQALDTITSLPGGNAITINPEATRIRNGGMQKARREITLYWHTDKSNPNSVKEEDIWFLPIAHEGTEQQWPNGFKLPYYLTRGAYKHQVRFMFGKPFKLDHVMEQLSHLDLPRRDRKQMEVDLIFNQVARLHIYHPEGNPDYADGEPVIDIATGMPLENGGGYYTRLNDQLVAAGVQFSDDFKDLSQQLVLP